MANTPFMVQTAYNVLNEVFRQWQEQPYRWMKERDLQAEIGGRITQILSLQGMGSVRAHNKWASEEVEKSKRDVWSRVSYETYVGFDTDGQGRRSYCFPDIILWEDPGENWDPGTLDGQLCPILWACELKYNSPDAREYDVAKLALLILEKRVRYGCVVKVRYQKLLNAPDVNWTRANIEPPQGYTEQDMEKVASRLWIVDVTLPQNLEPV